MSTLMSTSRKEQIIPKTVLTSTAAPNYQVSVNYDLILDQTFQEIYFTGRPAVHCHTLCKFDKVKCGNVHITVMTKSRTAEDRRGFLR